MESAIGIVQALTGLGLAASGGEAKRKIAEGAVRVGGEKVSDPQAKVAPEAGPLRVSLGAKRHGILVAKASA